MKLNDEQKSVFEKVKTSSNNFFITGSAGTGKSYLLKYIVKYFLGKYGDTHVGVTAMTGLAAININGRTLHSWAGMGIDGKKKLNNFTMKNWNNCRVLIIDEISMMSMEYFESIFYKLRGVRVIMFGDFFQLPPVESKMIFHSPQWENLRLECIILKTIVRQTHQEFIKVLNNIRWGRITDEDIQWLKDNTSKNSLDDSTSLFPVNSKVEDDNFRRLDSISGDIVEITACDSFMYKKGNTGKAEEKKYENITRKNIERIAPYKIKLKLGSRVMLTKNSKDNYRLVNGSIGKVMSISKDKIIILFENTGLLEVINKIIYTDTMGNVTLNREQYPLKLAWSLTIHKSQGLTLNSMNLTMKDSFEDGQCYVGISRASDPSKLFIDDIDNIKVSNRVNRHVKLFYENLETKD